MFYRVSNVSLLTESRAFVVSRGRRLVMGLSFLRVPFVGSFKGNQRDT